MSAFRSCILAAIIAASAFGQISQDRPELCGKSTQFNPVPAGITAVSSGTSAVLYTPPTGSQAGVLLSAGAVDQVCPLSGSRLVVFGSWNSTATDVAIINTSDGRLLDELWANNAVISQDQRWLVFRGFYPYMSEVPTSDQYLLYDLNKDASENRMPNRDQVWAEGKVLYPAVLNQVPFNSIGLPPEQIHDFRSEGFHWTADSTSVVFADDAQGQTSVVWVKIGPDGAASERLLPG